MLFGKLFFTGGLMLIIMTIAYYLCPARYLKKKNEYVKFFLVFFSAWFLLMFIAADVLLPIFDDARVSHSPDVKFMFMCLLIPALYFFHWIYQFKTVKKSQHLSFFLFFATLFLFVGSIVIFMTSEMY